MGDLPRPFCIFCVRERVVVDVALLPRPPPSCARRRGGPHAGAASAAGAAVAASYCSALRRRRRAGWLAGWLAGWRGPLWASPFAIATPCAPICHAAHGHCSAARWLTRGTTLHDMVDHVRWSTASTTHERARERGLRCTSGAHDSRDLRGRRRGCAGSVDGVCATSTACEGPTRAARAKPPTCAHSLSRRLRLAAGRRSERCTPAAAASAASAAVSMAASSSASS